MIKILSNKKNIQKIMRIVLIVVIIGCMFQGEANANDYKGGTLAKPIVDFVDGLFDSILDFFHNQVYRRDAALRVDRSNGFWDWILVGLVGIATAVVVGAIIYFTAGLGGVILGLGFKAGAVAAMRYNYYIFGRGRYIWRGVICI